MVQFWDNNWAFPVPETYEIGIVKLACFLDVQFVDGNLLGGDSLGFRVVLMSLFRKNVILRFWGGCRGMGILPPLNFKCKTGIHIFC